MQLHDQDMHSIDAMIVSQKGENINEKCIGTLSTANKCRHGLIDKIKNNTERTYDSSESTTIR